MNGSTVVVTGAGRGLGLAMARRFAQEGSHAVIAEHDPELGASAAAALRAQGLSAAFEKLDVRDARQSQALVARLARERGRISTWSNNAGISRLGPAEALPLDDWDDSVATMLSGTFYCCQAAGQHMLAQGGGVILNIASVTGLLHEHGRVAYSTAKASVIALTQALGVEWAKRGVRVVGIAPGVVMTEMVQQTVEQGHGTLQTWQRRTPMRRLGAVDEIAEAALFLASDDASYVVGETLRVDGGWTAYQLF
jgi:NAD(P)-dependent dehydrogenase (short-subunit alcohol dehydrogenase family)